jgi:phospholipase C
MSEPKTNTGLFRPPSPPIAASDPIKHVIVLMFENHSFDQMLGAFKSIYPDLEGIDPSSPRSNKDSTGADYFQQQANDPVVSPDPKHELEHIVNSLSNGNGGFVSEYEREYPETTPDQRQRIMDYFGVGDLPALHALAQAFTICDHWYSSVPGPTWTNRFFAYSGTSKGIVDMPTSVLQTDLYLDYDQDTIFDRLSEKGISWKVYFGDVPNSLVLSHQRFPSHVFHYRLMHEFYEACQGPERQFPAFSFIEPNYFKGEQNDDHPSHSTMRAQRLLAHVYNILRKNSALWNSCLLVVLYDENGGFYDHVQPPAAVPPDQFQTNFLFDRLGVRVPALLISPWMGRRVLSTIFDHTSLLKYLIDKWHLAPLTERVNQAQTFAGAIRSSPRTDTPETVPVPPLLAFATPTGLSGQEMAEPTNDLQQALLVFSEHLATQTVPTTAPGRVVMQAAPPVLEGEIAKQRVLSFLNQQCNIRP